MRVQPKAAATRTNSEKKTHEARMQQRVFAPLLATLLLPTELAKSLLNGSVHPIGHADDSQCVQMSVFFFFSM
jgi:hypothetical protein